MSPDDMGPLMYMRSIIDQKSVLHITEIANLHTQVVELWEKNPVLSVFRAQLLTKSPNTRTWGKDTQTHWREMQYKEWAVPFPGKVSYYREYVPFVCVFIHGLMSEPKRNPQMLTAGAGLLSQASTSEKASLKRGFVVCAFLRRNQEILGLAS